MKLFHIGGLEILHVVLLADTLGGGVVLSSDELIASGTLFQTSQQVEDTALAIVEQKDAEVTAEILIPEGILVVEETQITNDAEDVFLSHYGETCSGGEGAVDAIHTTVAEDTMLSEDVRQTDSSTVGVVNSE